MLKYTKEMKKEKHMLFRRENPYDDLRTSLMADCKNCCGLCCTALYFSRQDGFPYHKQGGVPCRNLLPDFRCSIHTMLEEKGLKGCLAYDCFGAGQRVTAIYEGVNWRNSEEIKDQMFSVFLRVCQLHHILWYLTEAAGLIPAAETWDSVETLIDEGLAFFAGSPELLLEADVDAYRTGANKILKKAASLVSRQFCVARKNLNGSCIGKNFRRCNLDGQDFSLALLIGADLEGSSLRGVNFLGADFRDMNLSSTDLRNCLFLTQAQINSARGNRETKLPPGIKRPDTWKN